MSTSSANPKRSRRAPNLVKVSSKSKVLRYGVLGTYVGTPGAEGPWGGFKIPLCCHTHQSVIPGLMYDHLKLFS